jgi:hypothetical protein
MSKDLKKTASDGQEKMLAVSLSQEQLTKVCPIIEIFGAYEKIKYLSKNNLIWCISDH